MFCSKCGFDNSEENRFCIKCGHDLSVKPHRSTTVFLNCDDSTLLEFYKDINKFSKERQSALKKELIKRNLIDVDGEIVKETENNDIAENSKTVESNADEECQYLDTRFCKTCGNKIRKKQAVCLNCGVPAGIGKNYCYFCGNKLMENAAVCIKCGCATSETLNTASKDTDSEQYYRKLSDYEKTSGIIWLVIGIIQVCTVVGIICGVWNIIVGIQRLQYSKELLKKPAGVAQQFENQLTGLIIILVINIFFGAIIGVVGAIFDFYVRSYVLSNKEKYS